MQRFLHQLEQQFTGDIEVDDKTLEKYAYDRSIFYLKPKVVVFPRTIDDIKHLVQKNR